MEDEETKGDRIGRRGRWRRWKNRYGVGWGEEREVERETEERQGEKRQSSLLSLGGFWLKKWIDGAWPAASGVSGRGETESVKPWVWVGCVWAAALSPPLAQDYY